MLLEGESHWELRFYGVHGFWGGTNLRLQSSGSLWVQQVSRDLQCRRFQLSLESGEVARLCEALAQIDPLGELPDSRGLAPDEILEVLEIRGRGQRSIVREIGNAPALQAARALVLGLVEQASMQTPLAEGQYQDGAEIGLASLPPAPSSAWKIKLERHLIEFTAAHQRSWQGHLDMLPRLLERLPAKPALLASLLDRCLLLLAGGTDCGLTQEALSGCLRLGSQAGCALFQVAGGFAEVELDGRKFALSPSGLRGEAHVARFLGAFYLNWIVGDELASAALTRVPWDVFVSTGVRSDLWLRHWIEALQAFQAGRDPGGACAETRKWAAAEYLQNSTPQAASLASATSLALDALFGRDGWGFRDALEETLLRHRQVWGSAGQAQADAGWVCLPALGLQAVARRLGIDLPVDSAYVPNFQRNSTPA